MKNSNVVSLTLLLILIGFRVCYGSLQCECDKSNCIEPKSCRAGKRADMCSCCMVCAKEEGEICGGLNHIEGECGDKMQCMFRRLRNSRNRLKQSVAELVGRCEYVKCHYKGCPFGQACTLINNKPTCVCPVCKDMKNGPICGEQNNKQYNNECDLRLEECLTGIEIGLKDGLCNEQKLINVICDYESMRIEVSKSYFGEATGNQFSLLDDSCKLHENETHIYRTLRFNECMTKVLNTLTSIVYSNTLRTLTHLSNSKYENIQVPFECEYSLRNTKSKEFISHSLGWEIGKKVEDKLRANGVGIEIVEKVPKRRYRSVNAGMRVDINHIETYLIEMQSKVFAKYKALLSPTFCYASPIEKSQRWMKYIFIRRGCPIEDGVEILKAESPLIRMTVPSIKFREARYPGILVKCRIRACFPKTPSDKYICETTCPLNSHIRSRRDLSSKSKRVVVEYEITEQQIII